jgi:ethanolaminephosphotransferase
MGAAVNVTGKSNGISANGKESEKPHPSADVDVGMYFFLTPQAAKELPHYQYNGEDRSLIYRFILAPLALFCVNHLTPRWLAPNTITLVGLVFMALAYLLMWYYSPQFDSSVDDIPRWIFFYNAIAMLVYQTLDNMDGRQARRTGSSSPMGLLFDHGCDAINSLFGSANWMVAMAIDPRKDFILAWIILFGPYALFFVSTWEEYHTGALILPVVNGPNEGLLGGALVSLTSWYYGPQFWQQASAWDQLFLPALHSIPCLPAVLQQLARTERTSYRALHRL